MQLFLNKGKYAGMEFFSESVCNLYTKQQFPGNKRGAGFDRPNASGGGTCDELASQQSFGHSGFTGALAWADPKKKVIFIFLSNRVNPSQDNWKIRDLSIRTRIQHVIYQALQ
jgi:CubicO group peptidase (beta-lactamase class C family)